jgi:hypothetical protein
VRWVDAVEIVAGSLTWEDFEPVIVNRGNHVVCVVSVPDNAGLNLLGFPRSAGLAKLMVLTGRIDFPDHATASAGLHLVIIADTFGRVQH